MGLAGHPQAAAFGGLLAILVLYCFLRDARATLVTSIAIPVSVIGTFGIMYLYGFSLNNLSLMALIVAAGLVVDDAIVVLENIFRFVEEKKMSAMQAARAATAEIALPVMATTLSLVVISLVLWQGHHLPAARGQC